MKRKFCLVLLVLFLAFPFYSVAALYDRGIDNLGNHLIYDSGLNITWYDYTHPAADAADQILWASNLSVIFGGTVYADWRLPSTLPINGSSYQTALSYDGSTDMGFNITSAKSEIAYLFYVVLGNKAYLDTSGNVQTGWGLNNTGLFSQLHQGSYWSGNECSVCPGGFWGFDFYGGGQAVYGGAGRNKYDLAISVRSGDVAPVPIPGAVCLCASGLFGLMGIKRLRRRR